jgi:hypothetical protein
MERHPEAVEAIATWTAANGYDAAIWTALASNFHESDKANASFSVEAAVRYLERRDALTLDAALTYIQQAPRFRPRYARRSIGAGRRDKSMPRAERAHDLQHISRGDDG